MISVLVFSAAATAAHAAQADPTTAVTDIKAVQPAKAQPTPFADAIEKLKTGGKDAKRQAADLLGQSRDPAAIPHLMKALGDPNADVRLTVIESLGMLRAREAVGKLSDILSKDTDPRLRHSAAISLAYIGDPAAGPALTGALKDAHPGVRYAAVQAIGAVKYAAAEDTLIKLLQDSDGNMRRSAVSALGELRSAKAVGGLKRALEDKDKHVKLAAIQALGEIGNTSAAGDLRKSLEDPDDEIKMAAALALAKMADASGLGAAHEYVKSPDQLLKRQAIEVIVTAGDAKSLALLDELYAAEKDPGARQLLEYPRQKLAARLKSLQGK